MWHHRKSIKRGLCRPGYRPWTHYQIMQWTCDIRVYAQRPLLLHWVHSLVAETRTLTASVMAAKSLVSLHVLSLVACCWRSGWEHFSSNNRWTVLNWQARDEIAAIFLRYGDCGDQWHNCILFLQSASHVLNTRFNRQQNYDVKFRLYPYTTEKNDTGWYYS